MSEAPSSYEDLLAELEALRQRCEEAEEAIRAIRSGEVDVVVSGPDGEKVYTLQGADQSYRILVETMSEGAATLATDGTIVYCNRRMADMLGVPLEKAIGSSMRSFIAPADLQVFDSQMGLPVGESSANEITLLTAQSEFVPTLVSSRTVQMDEVTVISLVAMDLTEQKRNEEIVASERLARSILDQAGDAIIVCETAGRIIRANPVARELCGGDPLLQQFDQVFRFHNNTRHLFSAQTALGGETIRGWEVTLNRADGQLVHLILSASPLTNIHGHIIGCVVTLTDITERKRMENQIAWIASIPETSPNPVVEIDLAGAVHYLNPAARESFPDLETDGLRHPFLQGLDSLGSELQSGGLGIAGREVRVGDHFYQQTLKYVPEVLRLRIHGMDVTERKLAEERIRQINEELKQRVIELRIANEEMEAFSYSVSHDLRSPLAAIGGFVHVLAEEHGNSLSAEGRRFLDVIQSNTQRAGQLIDDLLAFSRMGRRPVKAVEIDMSTLLQSVIEEIPIPAGRIVEMDIRPLPPAHGDWTMLRQVFLNLMSNAVKFATGKPKAVIEIGGSAEGNDTFYYVKDNGIGFDMQYANKLFTVFQRLHTSEEFEGTGVGLAIIKRIIQRHGGRVWAVGKVGEGATFHFSLPKR